MYRIVSAVFFMLSSFSHAALYDRGNGFIYDDILDVTWLQDTNYARTSGYDEDGLMGWYSTMEWVNSLEINGHGDWRLPSAGEFPTGGTGELLHMFTENLGNLTQSQHAFGCPSGPAACLESTSFTDTVSGELISFENLTSDYFWYSTEPGWVGFDASYTFHNLTGVTSYRSKNFSYQAWVLSDGDIASVPVPSAIWLLGSGFLCLFGLNSQLKFRSLLHNKKRQSDA